MKFIQNYAYWFLGLCALALVGLQACSSNSVNPSKPIQITSTGPTYTPTPCTNTFGDSVTETNSQLGSGYLVANKYYFPGTTVKSLSCYTSGTGQFEMAIYGDNASVTAPGNLLAQSAATSTTVSPGWNTVAISPVTLSAGNYWLAIQTNGSVSFFYTFNSTTMPYITQAFGPFPSPFSGYVTCSCSVLSMYATYCP